MAIDPMQRGIGKVWKSVESAVGEVLSMRELGLDVTAASRFSEKSQ